MINMGSTFLNFKLRKYFSQLKLNHKKKDLFSAKRAKNAEVK